MEAKEFHKKFLKGELWIDAENLIKELTPEQRSKIIEALETTKEWMGIDMREEFYLGLMKSMKKEKEVL